MLFAIISFFLSEIKEREKSIHTKLTKEYIIAHKESEEKEEGEKKGEEGEKGEEKGEGKERKEEEGKGNGGERWNGKGEGFFSTKERFFSHLTKHLHNKLVHLPIGFSLSSSLLYLISFINAGFISSAKIIFLFGAISSIPTYFSGEAQEEKIEAVDGEDKDLETHEKFGTITTILFIILAILQFIKRAEKIARIIIILFPLLITITGYFGGIVAHG